VFNRRKPEDGRSVETMPDETKLAFQGAGATALSAGTPEDNGLDLPPFRPNPPDLMQNPQAFNKEILMARSPFSPAMPPSPTTVLRPPVAGLAGPSEAPVRDGAERRTLVVGRGISVQGTVQDAERLVVEGTVEAAMINGLTELAIAHGGVFKGEVEVDEAEVAGTIDGTLTARNALIIRSTGRVLGTARCRRLQVEDGGQMTGRIEMLSEPPAVVHAVRALEVE